MRALALAVLACLTLGCTTPTSEAAHNKHWRLAEQHWQAYMAATDDKSEQYHLERARYFDQIAAEEFQIELGGYYDLEAARTKALGAAAAASLSEDSGVLVNP